jgi:2-dehydro-3-deoxygalactonokinase
MNRDAFLAIDCGTTNTRVWLLRGGDVAARAEVEAGVRDTARTGSPATLKGGISHAIEQAAAQAGGEPPDVALAAGMITSPLGLVNIPHVPAPVASADLSAEVRRVEFPDYGGLAVYFVPGVRSGTLEEDRQQAPNADIIRGEETEIFGTLEMLDVSGPLLYVHLGSHTKMVRLDRRGRIVGGITTLAGELDHVVRTETILSAALPPERMEECDGELLDQGAAWAQKYGLSRTFFLLRILEQSGGYTPHELGSVFAGAIASEDLHAMRGHGLARKGTPVVLSGRPRFQSAWRRFLEREGLDVTSLSEEDTEAAFLMGLQRIVFDSSTFQEAERG